MGSAIPTGVWPYITGTLIALLLVSIMLAVIIQFKMDRTTPRPWPEGMEPPDEHFKPVTGRLVGRESLDDVIYSAERIVLDERKLRKESNVPWYVPYKVPSKQGQAWLGKTCFTFYYRYTDDFFHLLYPTITRIDAFRGWYREYDFRNRPALIIHYVAGDNRFCVFQFQGEQMDSFARALARRVEQAAAADAEEDRNVQQGGHSA